MSDRGEPADGEASQAEQQLNALNEEAAALMQTAINEPHTPTPSELALIDSTTTQDINNLLHGSGSNISRKYTAKLPPLGEPLELDDAAYDTDLECEKSEKREPTYDLSHPRMYIETCKRLNIIPASFVMRHLASEKIIMPHHGLGPLGAKALCVPLLSNTVCLELNLEDNWLGDKGGVYVAEMMKENCYIVRLNVAGNRLGRVGGMAISSMLAVNVSVEHMNLSSNCFKDDVADMFVSALCENYAIKSINLSHNEFKLCGKNMGHALSENDTLLELDLSWNQFSGRSAIELLKGIAANSKMTRLDLSWNGLDNSCGLGLAEVMLQNQTLHDFDISHNRIGLDGIMVMVKGLKENEELRRLKIGGNPYGAPGAFLLLQAVNNEKSKLLELNMKHVFVEKEFDAHYREMLEARTDFKVVHNGILSNYVIKGPTPKPATENASPQVPTVEVGST